MGDQINQTEKYEYVEFIDLYYLSSSSIFFCNIIKFFSRPDARRLALRAFLRLVPAENQAIIAPKPNPKIPDIRTGM